MDDDADDEDNVVDDDGLLATETVGNPAQGESQPTNLRKSSSTTATHAAPKSAPKRVPIERRETIRPERTLENSQASRALRSGQLAKRRLKSFCTVVLVSLVGLQAQD